MGAGLRSYIHSASHQNDHQHQSYQTESANSTATPPTIPARSPKRLSSIDAPLNTAFEATSSTSNLYPVFQDLPPGAATFTSTSNAIGNFTPNTSPKHLRNINTEIPEYHSRGRTPLSPKHRELPRPPLSPIPSGIAVSRNIRPNGTEIAAPFPQIEHPEQISQVYQGHNHSTYPTLPQKTGEQDEIVYQESPSFSNGALDEAVQLRTGSSPYILPSQLQRPGPGLSQPPSLDVRQPGSESAYTLRDNVRSHREEPQGFSNYLGKQSQEKNSTESDQRASHPDSGSVNSASILSQAYNVKSQSDQSGHTSQQLQQPYEDVSQRSSFYTLDGRSSLNALSGDQLRSEASSPDGPSSSQSRSEGHSSPGTSRTASQYIARPENGFSYSTQQLQQDYALAQQGQQYQRRRVPSGSARSNAGSLYNSNAISTNPNLSSAASGGDAVSIISVPPLPILLYSHLRPGDKASLLSHQKTLEAYRSNVKKTNDPDITYEFATFMFGIAKEMGQNHGQKLEGNWSQPPSEENLLSSLHELSASPSPDPSLSYHSRSSGSSGDLHAQSASIPSSLDPSTISPSGPPTKQRGSSNRRISRSPGGISVSSHLSTLASSPTRIGSSGSDRRELILEAISLLKRNADRGHPASQFFLADCYVQGIGTQRRSSSNIPHKECSDGDKAESSNGIGPGIATPASSPSRGITRDVGKPDYDRAIMLFTAAAKHGHVPSCFRTGECYEKGWGCRRDTAKAVQFYM